DHEEFVATAKRELLACVREYRRHPCILLWSLGNEMIVSCERDIGLAASLFTILNDWTAAVHRLDARPVLPSSNGDGVDSNRFQVGDVDSVHQYGGWYVENLGDLKHFSEIVAKHDTENTPIIVTESVAAYTDDQGRFFIKDGDVRQRKVVRQRMGRLDGTPEEDQAVQSTILKEYAETLWRLRRPGSAFSGYIPFGQYTWFSHPFSSEADAIQPKIIWETYRRVLGPCHVQLECTHRHLFDGDKLQVTLRFYHENVELASPLPVHLKIRQGKQTLWEGTATVAYHQSIALPLELPVQMELGGRLEISAFSNEQNVAENILDIRFYTHPVFSGKALLYDPAALLPEEAGERIADFGSLKAPVVVIGPYAWDRRVELAASRLLQFVEAGGRLVILEQSAGCNPVDMLGETVVRKLQPYWSRWARNLNYYADRADPVKPEHPFFQNVKAADLQWWNGDTYVGVNYLSNRSLHRDSRVLLSLCNGLADNELMPIEHPDVAPDCSLLMLEQPHGKGTMIFCQALVGNKSQTEPVAAILLSNLLR
ncbi:MAG: glycoside hydrolase family 2 TIM barrel-domain containing protein, partial [Victivallaceae bacterium]|nr:glycoside hydrolase family 2 TIM barrel-domain containing protein [Victivallaceae bacterium]